MKALYYILFFCTTFSFAQSDALFKKANNLYNAENYEQAIATYNQLLSTKKHSSEVYFNLANAHYKLHHLPQSIYYYEKALQLNPNNEDAKINLSFANNQKIDKIDSIPETGFSKMINTFINIFHFDTWGKLAILFLIAFVLAVIAYMYTPYSSKKRIYFVVAALAMVLSLLSLAFAYQQEANVKHTVYAIVFSPESHVKTEPKLSAEEAFVLHEGTKVQVLESYEGWSKIKLTNGSEGWIVSKDIQKL